MTDAADPTNAETTARAIRSRMAHLAMSQAELVRASGVSDFTIRKLASGQPANYREANLRKLSRALQWPSEAIEGLLAGIEIGQVADRQVTSSDSGSGTDAADGTIRLSASGADLEELRLADPDAYELVLDMARAALDRARARREQ